MRVLSRVRCATHGPQRQGVVVVPLWTALPLGGFAAVARKRSLRG
jgi:hypothetical protein